MTRRGLLRGCVFVSAGLCFVPSTGDDAAERCNDSTTLELSVSVQTGTFVLYEPVVVTYSVTNPTDVPVEAMVFMPLSDGSINLYVSPSGAPRQLYQSGPNIEVAHSRPNRFEARERKSRAVGVFYNDLTGTLAFPRPGSYTIRARLHVSSYERGYVTVEAQPLGIQIVEPSRIDQEAIEWFGSPGKLIWFLRDGVAEYCKGTVRALCLKRLGSFLERFSGSSYAPTVAFYLALAKSSKSGGMEGEVPNSGELLEKFFELWPDHPWAPDMIASLVDDLVEVGQRSDANRWIERFRRDYPDRRDQLTSLQKKVATRGGG